MLTQLCVTVSSCRTIQQGQTHNMGAATAPLFSAFGLAAAHLLGQYQKCAARGVWTRLVFETHGGDERFSFSCTNPRV